MKRLTLVPGLLILLGIAACQDADSPAEPASPAFDLQQASSPRVITWDDRLAAIDVPGFAGFYTDDAGQLVVRSVNGDVDRSAMADRLSQLRAVTAADLPTDFRVEGADYAFVDLQRWRIKMRSLLPLPDVNSLSIDDAANRIALGITPGASTTALIAQLERLDVPVDAVTFKDQEPAYLTATLRDKVRDTVGGLKIQNDAEQVCTMGFNAFWGADRVFITNSHCTDGRGGVQGGEYYQPTCDSEECTEMRGPWVPPGNVVGVELKDPAWWVGCDGENFCRYSDSAIIDYYRGVGSDLGEIARTTGWGSITISTTTPRWIITGEQAMMVDQVAHRVGQRNGYRYGDVEDTCDDIDIGDYTTLCSVRYDVGGSTGDSGAPVFRVISSNNVSLVGINFASSATKSWFSPISQIRQELETPLNSLVTY